MLVSNVLWSDNVGINLGESMAGETLSNRRNFGQEIRDTKGDRAEQGQILRDMICSALAGETDENAARRVLDAFHDAELAIVTEEGWQEGVRASDSLQRLGDFATRLRASTD